MPGGLEAVADKHGQLSHASSPFATAGDAQVSEYVLRTETTDATANVEMFLNGSSLQMVMAVNTAWTFTVHIVAYSSTSDIAAGYTVHGCIRRNGAGVTALAAAVTADTPWEEGAMSGCSVLVDNDTTALRIRVTGIAGGGTENIGWVAHVRTVEVTYP